MADWLDEIKIRPVAAQGGDWLDSIKVKRAEPPRPPAEGLQAALRAATGVPASSIEGIATNPAIAAAMARLAMASRQPKPEPPPRDSLSLSPANLLGLQQRLDPIAGVARGLTGAAGAGLSSLLNARSNLYGKTPELFGPALERLPANIQAIQQAAQGTAGQAGPGGQLAQILTGPLSRAALPAFGQLAQMTLPRNVGEAAEGMALYKLLTPKIKPVEPLPIPMPPANTVNPRAVLTPKEFAGKIISKRLFPVPPAKPIQVVSQQGGAPRISSEQFRLSLQADELVRQTGPLRNLEGRLVGAIQKVAKTESSARNREPLARQIESRLAGVRETISKLEAQAAELRRQANMPPAVAARAAGQQALASMAPGATQAAPAWYANISAALPRFGAGPLDIADEGLESAGKALRIASEAFEKRATKQFLSPEESAVLAAFGGRSPDIGSTTQWGVDIARIAEQADRAGGHGPNGPFMRLARSLLEAEVRATELAQKTNDAWLSAFPAIKQGSKESHVASRYAQQGLPEVAPLTQEELALMSANPQIKASADSARAYYDWMLERMNAMNRALGQPEIPKHKHYITHINDMRAQYDIFGGPDPKTPDWTGRHSVPFKYAKERLGEVEFYDIANSVLDYNKKALRSLHINPVAKKIFAFSSQEAAAMPKKIGMAFEDAAKFAVGNPVISTQEKLTKELAIEMPPSVAKGMASAILTESGRLPVGRLMIAMNNNIRANVALGNAAFVIAQLQSFPLIMGKVLNPKFIFKALADMYGPNAKAARAAVLQDSIAVRSHLAKDSAVYSGSNVESIQKKLGYVMSVLDEEMSMLGFLAGAHRARALGYVNKADIVAYADSVSNAANAILTRGNTPAVLRGTFMNIIFPFSRMAANAAAYTRFDLVRDGVLKTAQNAFALTSSAFVMNGVMNGAFSAIGVRREKNIFDISDLVPPIKMIQFGTNPLPLKAARYASSAVKGFMDGDAERTLAGLAKFSLLAINPFGGGQQIIQTAQGRPLGGRPPSKQKNKIPF